MFAVIETGGKQYLVKSGDTVNVEKLPVLAGETVTFDKILLVAEDDGTKVQIGQPYLEGVTITATVEAQARHTKIRVVKYKRKVRYTRVHGHRQHFSKVKIAKV